MASGAGRGSQYRQAAQLAKRGVPVAIEVHPDARPLTEYQHPERAFYIFGPEDGSLDKDIRDWCEDVIYIPTNGCMNLAATVNVVLYDRMAKGNNTRSGPQFR